MRPRLLCATLVASVAGCAHSPSTQFYVLAPTEPASSMVGAGSMGVPIRVIAVHIPAELDRPELVGSVSANQLVLQDFAHWAAPLGQLARQTLTEDLVRRLPAGRVLFPDAPDVAPRRDLVVDVLSFTQSGGAGVLDLSWTLAAEPGAAGRTRMEASVQGPSSGAVRLTEPITSPGPRGEAEVISRLLGRASDDIARDIMRTDMVGA